MTWHDATSHHITSQDLTWHPETPKLTTLPHLASPHNQPHYFISPRCQPRDITCHFTAHSSPPPTHHGNTTQPPPKILEEREKFVRRGRTWSSASHLTGKMAGKVTHKHLGDWSWCEDEPCLNLLGSNVTKSALTRFRTSSCSSFQPYQGKPCPLPTILPDPCFMPNFEAASSLSILCSVQCRNMVDSWIKDCMRSGRWMSHRVVVCFEQ